MIIGICGGTGSGKTTIAREVLKRVGEENLNLIQQDSYYINLSEMPLDERRRANFDHPDAVDFESIVDHLSSLKNGDAVEIPVYNFKTHTRNEETSRLEPKPVVIIEGILIFSEPRIVELLDIKVFIDTPDDVRLLRRIRRDIKERGRTLDHTLWQYEKTIRPMHYEYVEPSKKHADVIIPDGGNLSVLRDLLCGIVRERISDEESVVV